MHVAAENGSSQLIPRSGQEQFGAIGTRVLIRPAPKLALHIAFGKNAIHGVVLPQEERRLAGLQLLPLPRQSHRSEHDLPGLLRNHAAIRIQTKRLRPANVQRDRRQQGHRARLGHIFNSDSRTGCLRRLKHYLPGGGSVPRVLIEDQPVGFKMNRVFRLRRSRLVRMPHPLGIRFQVNQHRALRTDVARRGIVLEIIPGNPVETASILAVDDDLDAVQLRPSAPFELNRLGSAHGKQSAAFFRFGDGKALGGLLNVQADFRGDVMYDLVHPPARVEIHPGNRCHHQNRAQGEPAAQT